jgi:hypothetical protein
VIVTKPSAGDGHRKRLRPSRFANRHMPCPSCQSTLIKPPQRVLKRPAMTRRWRDVDTNWSTLKRSLVLKGILPRTQIMPGSPWLVPIDALTSEAVRIGVQRVIERPSFYEQYQYDRLIRLPGI